MKRLLILVAILAMPAMSSAQIIEEVHTKNGSKYAGYISEQIPGKQMSVCTESAYIVFNKANVANFRKDYYDFNSLNESSKDLIRDVCDTTSLHLASFEYNGTHYENLYVKETTETSLYTYSLTPRTFYIPWSEIVKTTKLSDRGIPYGLREVITLKSGERFVGHVHEQIAGQNMTFEDTDGNRHEIDSNEVLSILVEKISNKHDIWTQTPYLDRVFTSDSTMLEGLITSRVIGKSVSIMLKNNSESKLINAEDVKKYQKTRNSTYKPYIVDTSKLVSLNGIEATPIVLTKVDGNYVRTDMNVNTFTVGTDLNLVIKNIPHGETIAIYEFQVRKRCLEQSFIIPENALPIYETTLNSKDNYEECSLIIRKPGKYYIAIDGFENGLNVVFEKIKE